MRKKVNVKICSSVVIIIIIIIISIFLANIKRSEIKHSFIETKNNTETEIISPQDTINTNNEIEKMFQDFSDIETDILNVDLEDIGL